MEERFLEHRHQQWDFASRDAGRRGIYKNSVYYSDGDVWVPQTLSQGDIIRCDLLTDFYQNGKPEIYPRNCLVVGLDVDEETLELTAIHLVRFSYFAFDFTSDYELCIDPADPQFRLKVSGLRLGNLAVLRTGKIEVVPVCNEHFGFYIDRVGQIQESLFPLVEHHLHLGQKSPNARRMYVQTEQLLTRSGETIHIPSLSAARLAHAYDFGLMPKHKTFFGLDNEESQDFIEQAGINTIAKIIGRSEQLAIQSGIRQAANERKEQAAKRLLQQTVQQLRRQNPTNAAENTTNLLIQTQRQLENATTDMTDGESSPPAQPSSMPLLRDIIADQLARIESERSGVNGMQRILHQEIDPDSLSDLATLGIGGLMREPTIELPEHIWKGRYVLARVPNLFDPADMNMNVYRPCAIWKAYARINEDGDPVLAGFELHPCTRNAAHAFQYKMGVRPFRTTVNLPSYLIADMIIRVEISAQHLQPWQKNGCNELLPHQVADMDRKRALVLAERGEFKVYGLQQVPEDWIEIKLPEPPHIKMQQRLSKMDICVFTHSNNSGGFRSSKGLKPRSQKKGLG